MGTMLFCLKLDRYNVIKPMDAHKQIAPVIHHSKLKLTNDIANPPIIGAMICAVDQAVVYKAA